MKKLLLTTALTSLMALSASSFAADTSSGAMSGATDSMNNTTSEMKGHMGAKMMKGKMEADAARLNLTPDQKTKIDGLMKESKMKLDTDIKAVLDDKQKVEFDKIQAEHKEAWSKMK
jgi:Spy/CpxP family protein refolding chaperone